LKIVSCEQLKNRPSLFSLLWQTDSNPRILLYDCQKLGVGVVAEIFTLDDNGSVVVNSS